MSDMCKWWRDGDTVLPQLTFKGGGSPQLPSAGRIVTHLAAQRTTGG